jgi:aspartyl-tRNA(Asn)/glutamyl-tRNA(Gln) amidotransferase subunit A
MDPFSTSMAELHTALRRRRVSVAEVVEASVRAHRPEAGAYRLFDPDGARALATALDRGPDGRSGRPPPLWGIPGSVKDLFGLRGTRTYAGTRDALPPRFEREGPLVRAIGSQGAVWLGKTHTVELAFGGIGTNPHWGTPSNLRAPDHVPGGSSSGAVTSVLEGSAWFALGTDTAGSVRIPASFSGAVGFKPGPGQWSTEGIVPLSFTLDTPGVLTRSVHDAAFVWSALAPSSARADLRPSELRLGVLRRPLFADASDGVSQAVQEALDALAGAGAQVRDARVPEVGAALRLFAKGTVTGTECHAFVRTQLGPWMDRIDPNVAARIRRGGAVPGSEYLRRRRRIEALRRSVASRFRPGEWWVGPTTARTAPHLAEVGRDYAAHNLLALRNTSVANQLGLCALSLPCGCDAEGRPVGLMIMGPGGAEAELLAVGRAVESCLGTGAERLGVPGPPAG